MIEDKKESKKLQNIQEALLDEEMLTPEFIKKSFEAVLQLHEEILWEKEERIISLKEENEFLKESLYALQSIYDEDKTTIKLLSEQLKNTQEELEFVKRKYKMMWNQAIENYSKKY